MTAVVRRRRRTASPSCHLLLLTCSCLLMMSSNPTALVVLQPGPPVVARGSRRAVGSPAVGGLHRSTRSCSGVQRSWCGVVPQHQQQQQQRRRAGARTSTSRCSMINNIFDTRARSQVGGWVLRVPVRGIVSYVLVRCYSSILVRSVYLVSNSSVRDTQDTRQRSTKRVCAAVS